MVRGAAGAIQGGQGMRLVKNARRAWRWSNSFFGKPSGLYSIIKAIEHSKMNAELASFNLGVPFLSMLIPVNPSVPGFVSPLNAPVQPIQKGVSRPQIAYPII